MTGPRVLTAFLILLFAGFWFWYGGNGSTLTAAEIDQYIDSIRDNARNKGKQPNEHLLSELNQLAASDDGKQYCMVNLIRYREKSQYPKGSPFADYTPEEANRAYGKALMPYLLKHGGHPVLISQWQGPFIQPKDVDVWDDVSIIRYRSRRDMLEMVKEFTATDQDVAVHKWASIEKTQVFPVTPVVSLASARLTVAVALLVFGVLLHLLLSLLPFYRR